MIKVVATLVPEFQRSGSGRECRNYGHRKREKVLQVPEVPEVEVPQEVLSPGCPLTVN